MIDISNLTRNGKMYMLAYDQGLEHGPVDFNDYNCLPENILELAVSGGATCFACQKGIAEKYYTRTEYRNQIPLILKLNGKTSYIKDSPYSPALATIDEAIQLGAYAVGYTVYVGSPRQDEMFKEFSEIIREAHKNNIPVIGWMYPRSANIPEETVEVTAYAARVGLELGADIVKVKPHDDLGGMKWIVRNAGRCKVVFQGGNKTDEDSFLDQVKMDVEAGGLGLAVGRNIWQAENPLEISRKVCDTIWS
ncbi:MAG: fructose-bisphosphate aldolase [bacterium]